MEKGSSVTRLARQRKIYPEENVIRSIESSEKHKQTKSEAVEKGESPKRKTNEGSKIRTTRD